MSNIQIGDIWECNDGETFYIIDVNKFSISFIGNYEGHFFINSYDSTDDRFKNFTKNCKYKGKSQVNDINNLFKIVKE